MIDLLASPKSVLPSGHAETDRRPARCDDDSHRAVRSVRRLHLLRLGLVEARTSLLQRLAHWNIAVDEEADALDVQAPMAPGCELKLDSA